MIDGVPTWAERLQKLLFNLLYPAVLGAFFYDILLAGEPADWFGRLIAADHKLLVAVLLMLLFMFDFMFTQEIGGYRVATFPVDILIVIALFYGYTGIHLHGDKSLDTERVALSLSCIFFCFLLWITLMRRELRADRLLVGYELAAVTAYLIAVKVGISAGSLAASLMAGTAAMAMIGSRTLKKYHRRRMARVAN